MEIFGTARRNVECSIRITQKDTVSPTENYGPYTKLGRRKKKKCIRNSWKFVTENKMQQG